MNARPIGLATPLAVLAIAVAAASVPTTECKSPDLEFRWVYCAFNLQVDENVDRLEQLMTRASAAGYNGILLADYKLNVLDRVPDRYFNNLARIRGTAQRLKLDLIPAVMPIGYSEGLLAHDPNLAEGMPVRNQRLVVHGGMAEIAPDPPVRFDGAGFETAQGDKFTGWDFQDLAGRSSFVDTQTKHSGQSSLRIRQTGAKDRDAPNCRVMKKLAVAPYRQYHLSVWIKSNDFRAHSSVRLFAMGSDGAVLSHSNLGVNATQDWTQHHVIFNSLSNREVNVYCGVWGISDGTLWLDDLVIEETAFVNLLRRPGCPLSVSCDDGRKLTEGTDFVELSDSRMGATPWPGGFDVYHEPPRVQFKGSAGVKDGDRLVVNYYHAVTVYDAQVACCLSEPKVFELLSDQVSRVQQLLEPRGFMMSHDEVRVAGWCASCQNLPEPRTSGDLLAENVRHCVDIIQSKAPGAGIFVWSDMFDPSHNAVDKFYLDNGTMAGSWNGLPPEVTIVNWNHRGRAKSLPFFAERGHRQILAGYYDGAPESIADWLSDADDKSNIAGVMYTTWRQNYDHLETFARRAWGDRKK